MYQQARYRRRTLFELDAGPGQDAEMRADGDPLSPGMCRDGLGIPDLPEREVVKHFTQLSQMNFGVDSGFYPLGSCTMKYNPKYCDALSALPQVSEMHPLQDESTCQGSLELIYRLERALCAISGMDAVTLQPAAGAHGEFTGMLIARAYHESRGDRRTEVVIPDSAHGTNPASAAMAGFEVVEVPSGKDGLVDIEALRASLSDRTAAFMITNPNTLGLFERNIEEIAGLVHSAGALLYYDGANFNAILGKTSPGRMGFDIMHFNLHKTFATPHGGGGPGAGPVGVRADLEKFLPGPRVKLEGDRFRWDDELPDSIGKMHAYHGNFAVLVRAYAYIIRNGADGLREASEAAVLGSNYLRHRISEEFEVPFEGRCMHEFVASARKQAKERGVRALDIAKAILDEGMMAPTIYFPALVEEAMMIEPTETETKETLDDFAEALIRIARGDPAAAKAAPMNTACGRVDELYAAKELVLTWKEFRKREGA